jgi:hypothetical protein
LKTYASLKTQSEQKQSPNYYQTKNFNPMNLLYSTSTRIDMFIAVVLMIAGLWLFLDDLNDKIKEKKNAED